MKKLLLIGFILLFTGVHLLNAQVKKITGTVSEADGTPIPGASVLIKGTSNGTITDFDGNFALELPSGSNTLVVSFVGMRTKEVEVDDKTTLKISLEVENIGLNEVLVTAMGIERSKKSIGYAVVDVKAEETIQKSEPDVLRSLQGKIAGVEIRSTTSNPGSSTRITIRGVSSFLGENQPLFVVDGIPYSNEMHETSDPLTTGSAYTSGIATLDPHSIESIQVLKGSAAAALYGSRAANGVVLITTKGGAAKTSKKGLEVTYKGSYSVDKILFPEYQNKYGAGHNHTFANDNGTWGAAFGLIDSIPQWPSYAEKFPDMPSKIPYKAYPNNIKDLFNTGKVVEHSISIEGGNQNSAVSLTATNMQHEGVIPNSEFERNGINLGANTKLENGLKVGAILNYSKIKQVGAKFGYAYSADAGAASSFARTMWLNRSWDMNYPYEDENGQSIFFKTDVDNPLWSWEHNKSITNIDRITGTINLEYDVTSWLNLKLKYGVNTYVDKRQQIVDIGSVGYSRLGNVIDYNIKEQEQEGTFSFTVNKKITNDFAFRAIGGYNGNQYFYEDQAVAGSEIIVPGIYSLSNTLNLANDGADYEKRRLYALFADIQLSFKDYLFLTLTGRNDWSSTLPKDSRSYFFSSYAASFVFSDAFNLTNEYFSSGKVNLSYGKVGNDADAYSLTDGYLLNYSGDGFSGSLHEIDLPYNSLPGLTRGVVKHDPNLTPEFSSEFEAGIEVSFFDSRVNLDLTYYSGKSTDQIAKISVPNATGYSAMITNFGEMTNKGFEAEIGLIPVSMENGLQWRIDGTFSKNKNKVVSLREGVERLQIDYLFSDINPVIEPGKPYGVFRGTRLLRDDEGNYLVDPITGEYIVNNEQDIIGDPNPDFKVGMINTLTYKKLSLSVVLDYTHGGDVYSFAVKRMLGRGVTKDTEERERLFVLPGYYGNPDTQEPLYDANGNKIPNTVAITSNNYFFAVGDNLAEEWSVFDATVLRLREVSLAYTLPAKWFNKIPIGSATISLSGRNLWFRAPHVPEYTNFDPEVNTLGASNAQGFDYGNTPATRRWGANIKLTF